MTEEEQWLIALTQLNVYRAKYGPAPHKALLLLVLLDVAAEQNLPLILELSPELAFRFAEYWSVVAHRRTQRPDVRLPFHHISTDGLWEALDSNMHASPHRSCTSMIRLNPSFHQFIEADANREAATRVLIESYFPAEERASLYALTGSTPAELDCGVASLDGAQRTASETIGRNARFRITVVGAYRYCCALTGFSVLTIDALSIVDAAHIHAFAESRNDSPCNGIALCKNAHWLFDQGLWSLADDYTVIVSDSAFQELAPDQRSLASYSGQKIRLPRDSSLWPDRKVLAWHRRSRLLK